MSWRGLLPLDLQEARVIGQVALTIPTLALLLIAVSQLVLGREWALVADINTQQASIINGVIIPVLLVAKICFIRWGAPWAVAPAMIVVGALGVLLTCVSNILSNDATAGGMVFYAVPVLFGAFVLGTSGAAVLLVSSVGCMAVNFLIVEHRYLAVQEIAATSAALILLNVLICRARSQEMALRLSLQKLAQTDVLTGFCTRQVLDEKLEKVFTSEKDAVPVSLLIIDVDHFKTVNDQHGHPVGDAALRHIAHITQSSIQESDLAVRLGGDELAVLLVGKPPSQAMTLARSIAQKVRDTPLPSVGDEGVALSVSIGVGASVSTSGTPGDLYVRADDGLYAAKCGGRDQAAYAQGGKPHSLPAVHQTGKLC